MKTFLTRLTLWLSMHKVTRLCISFGRLMEDGAVLSFLLFEYLKIWRI